MVHQMYLRYLLLIFKKINFGFAFSEKIASSFNFLTLLLNLFCKTVISGVWINYCAEPFPTFTELFPEFIELLWESAITPFTNATTVWTNASLALHCEAMPGYNSCDQYQTSTQLKNWETPQSTIKNYIMKPQHLERPPKEITIKWSLKYPKWLSKWKIYFVWYTNMYSVPSSLLSIISNPFTPSPIRIIQST